MATPGKYYTDYYSAFVQDDYRITVEAVAELRPSLRIRAGHFRQGQPLYGRLRSRRVFPMQVPGMELKGGLMYAGVDGYPTRQGKPLNSVRRAAASPIRSPTRR